MEPQQTGKTVIAMHDARQTMRQIEKENIELREKIAIAYGYLWHVNNEPMTPCQYPPERAAYEARKILRDTMTHEQRGDGINAARELMGCAATLGTGESK
jgi:hypothetical protein